MGNLSQDARDGALKFSPDKDRIFRGDQAEGVLKYLLTDVRYKPDDPYFSFRDAVDFGMPKKPRYQLVDGDYAINEYPNTKGYYLDEKVNKWIAFDNSSNDCFVEEFESEAVAFDWICGNFDVV